MAVKKYKRPLTILALLAFAFVHSVMPARVGLDWPTVALLGVGLCLFLVPRLELLLPFVKKLKLGEAEIELREHVVALAISVDKSERSAPQISTKEAAVPSLAESRESALLDDPYKRLMNTEIEAHILDLAAKDKQAALMRLAIEIEKEVLILQVALGLSNESKPWQFNVLIDQLQEHGAITEGIKSGLLEFRKVRNQIVHVSQPITDSVLTSTLDSGIRLLRLLKAIPRQRYKVVDPHVVLYTDRECKERIADFVGVILEFFGPDGKKRRVIAPAGGQFSAGEVVGGDWDLNRICGLAFYRDRESRMPTRAWLESPSFIGKTFPSSDA